MALWWGLNNVGQDSFSSVTKKFTGCPASQNEVLKKEGHNFSRGSSRQCGGPCISGQIVYGDVPTVLRRVQGRGP